MRFLRSDDYGEEGALETIAATLSATSLLAVAGILGGMVLGMIWVSH